MPRAIGTLPYIWYHADRGEISGRGWHIARCSVEGLGLVLAAALCPDQPQDSNKVNNSQAFPQKKNVHFVFWTNRFSLLQGMSVQRFLRNNPKI